MRLVTASEIGCSTLHPEERLILLEDEADMDEFFANIVNDKVSDSVEIQQMVAELSAELAEEERSEGILEIQRMVDELAAELKAELGV